MPKKKVIKNPLANIDLLIDPTVSYYNVRGGSILGEKIMISSRDQASWYGWEGLGYKICLKRK